MRLWCWRTIFGFLLAIFFLIPEMFLTNNNAEKFKNVLLWKSSSVAITYIQLTLRKLPFIGNQSRCEKVHTSTLEVTKWIPTSSNSLNCHRKLNFKVASSDLFDNHYEQISLKLRHYSLLVTNLFLIWPSCYCSFHDEMEMKRYFLFLSCIFLKFS